MATETCQESQVYKHVILCYAVLTGEQPPTQFHFGLIDVVDFALGGQTTEAKEQLALMSLRICRLLAQSVCSRIELAACSSPPINNVSLSFLAKIEQVDQFQDLDKCQAAQMILSAINKALKSVGSLMTPPVDYPDLEKLKP